MGKPSDAIGSDRLSTSAKEHATGSAAQDDTILPPYDEKSNTNETGGLDSKKDGRGRPSGSSALKQHGDGGGSGRDAGGGSGLYFGSAEKAVGGDAEAGISKSNSASTPSQIKSENEGAGDPAIASAADSGPKPPITTRMLNGTKRFFDHMKDAICHSWINVLLIFIPIGIAAEAASLNAGIVFGMNAVAIVPLAGLLAYATESVAARLGDTLGALLNVSFGNAVELIIFIIALVKNEIQIVQASLLGSILANLLLILGMSFLFGGLRYREQIYNSTVTQMSACLLSLSVMSLLLPTAFYASFAKSSASLAKNQVLKVSRGTSVVLLLVYILYLLFQLKTHAYMYESTPQEVIDEESHPGVLADIMNSSSSSDTSSTSDTDTDSSGSGSIAIAGKKIKRVFKNRRQRKSSSSTTPGSGEHSALSSPSTTERQAANYWESQGTSKNASRRGSTLGAIASGDEADHEDAPRVRDFVRQDTATEEGSKSPERKKHRKKHRKRHQKKRAKQQKEEIQEDTILDQPPVQTPAKEEMKEVGFADEVQVVGNPAPGLSPVKSSLNMRSFPRPVLPKMFSQNVFVTPAPVPGPAPRPSGAARSQSSGANLRRTSSLPDRLNRGLSQMPSRGQQPTFVLRSDPLPPFHHRARQALRKIRSEDTEGAGDEDEEDDAKPEMSRTAAVVLLLITTGLVAACAEFMVDAIPAMIAESPTVSQAFIGLIILPIVGNAAEHATAVTVATKNKMDLAIGVAVGSSIQIALFVTPIVVLLGWILNKDMSLYFNIFETISLFVTAFVVNFLVLDGRSNYLEGSLLCAAYVIIALGAFFYPDAGHQSSFGSVGQGGG